MYLAEWNSHIRCVRVKSYPIVITLVPFKQVKNYWISSIIRNIDINPIDSYLLRLDISF